MKHLMKLMKVSLGQEWVPDRIFAHVGVWVGKKKDSRSLKLRFLLLLMWPFRPQLKG